jgi:hypothetical protein
LENVDFATGWCALFPPRYNKGFKLDAKVELRLPAAWSSREN